MVTGGGRRRSPVCVSTLFVCLAASLGACGELGPRHVPDDVLQHELGLGSGDEVHTVRVTGGEAEVADPAAATVAPGAFVEFVTTDWFVHEVIFEIDSLGAAARDFLERTDQVESPPLIYRDSRFVVSFEDAPPGRYRYRLEGNGRPGGGVIVVAAADSIGDGAR